MKWTRKTAEEAVKFYSGLIERGSPLTAEEQRDLRSAAQFLRQVRKRPAFQNPRIPKSWMKGFKIKQDSVTKRWMLLKNNEVILTAKTRKELLLKISEGMIIDSNPFEIAYRRRLPPTKARELLHEDIVGKFGAVGSNPPTKIYGKVLQIKAEKQSGPYKGQRFFHDFKNATAYGLPNGDVLITSRKKI